MPGGSDLIFDAYLRGASGALELQEAQADAQALAPFGRALLQGAVPGATPFGGGPGGAPTMPPGFASQPAQSYAAFTPSMEQTPASFQGPQGEQRPQYAMLDPSQQPQLSTIDTAGGQIQVNSAAADDFRGFLADLAGAGAPVGKIGSYNARNIAGTNQPSKHAFGTAIDIGDQTGRNVVSPEFQRWRREHPQEWQDTLRRWNMISGERFSRPDLGHVEWAGRPEFGPQRGAAPSRADFGGVGGANIGQMALAIARANPGISPDMLARAVGRAMPYMKEQAAEQDRRLRLLEMQRQHENMMYLGLGRLGQAQENIQLRAERQDALINRWANQTRQGDERIALSTKRLATARGEDMPAPSLDEATVDRFAQMLNKGLTLPAGALGTGAVGNANKKAVGERATQLAQGGQPVVPEAVADKLMSNQLQLVGKKQMLRTAGNISARIDQAAGEVMGIIPIALKLSDKVDRTEYPDLNRLWNTANERIGDKDIVQFKNASFALANAWAVAMNRGLGQVTVESQREARERLNTAYSKGQFESVVHVMIAEMNSVLSSNRSLMKKYSVDEGDLDFMSGYDQIIRDLGGKPTGGGKPAPSGGGSGIKIERIE